jgi:hypothetical protein
MTRISGAKILFIRPHTTSEEFYFSTVKIIAGR